MPVAEAPTAMQEVGPVQETAFKPWLFREAFGVVTWGATLGVGDRGAGGWVGLTGWDGLEPEPGTSGMATMDQLDPFHSSARGSPSPDWSPTAAQKVVDVHETLSSTLSTVEFGLSGSADGVGAVRSVQAVPFHSETRPDSLEAPA